MTLYIDAYRASYGVERLCRILQVAPSSYYAAKTRPPSARSVNDAGIELLIELVHRANFRVYGMRRVWRAPGRLGVEAGRDQVHR